jgi:tetratricopeptide (TPR) repeat protein
MKIKYYSKFTILFLFLTFIGISNNLFAAFPSKDDKSVLKTSIELESLGTLSLEKSNNKQTEVTQLILKKSKKINIIVDNYEGLEPYELLKNDLDNDGNTEIVAVLRYPDSNNVVPYVYTVKEEFVKLFPTEENESKLLNCKEVFFSTKGNEPTLYLKYLVSYHDYAPPELYRLEMYQLKNGQLQLTKVGYNEGTHYNLLMNLAAEYLYNGKPLEAAALYNQSVASSTGDMDKNAFCEAVFCNAQALKFSGKYSEAMKLFEKLVLEYTDSEYTEIAQKELEFLFSATKDKNNVKILNQYYNIIREIEYEHSGNALQHLNQLIENNKNCSFMDVMLYTKAELLVSDNRVEEAMAVFTDIKVKYPNSVLLDLVEEMIENLECKPEDTEGL